MRLSVFHPWGIERGVKTVTPLTVLIFPVTLFAFGYPTYCCFDSFVSGLGAFCFGDPFYVFAFAAGAEGCER